MLCHFMVLLRMLLLECFSLLISSFCPVCPGVLLAAMERTALLFGLSSSTLDVLRCLLDLGRADGMVELANRDLDFYEVFCGAGKLSEQMEEVCMMHGNFFNAYVDLFDGLQ